MGNKYLEDQEAQASALLESTGRTPEDYLKLGEVPESVRMPTEDDVMAQMPGMSGMDASDPVADVVDPAPTDGSELQVVSPEVVPEAPAVDPQADIRSRMFKQLMETRYPERKDEGGLMTARGAGKASEAFYRAGGGKALSSDFFKPEDPHGEDVKKSQFELDRARYGAALLAKSGAGAKGAGGSDKSAGLLRATLAQEFPEWAAKNKQFLEVADVDELAKVGTQLRGSANLDFRVKRAGETDEQFERRFSETTRAKKFAEDRQIVMDTLKIDETEAGHVTKFSTNIKDHMSIYQNLEHIEKLAPGLTRGIVTKESAADLTSWDAISQDPHLKGLWNKLDPSEQNRRAAVLDSAVKNLAAGWVKSISGAAVTDEEFKRMDAILKNAVWQPPEVKAAAIDMLRQFTARKMQQEFVTVKTWVRPETIERYRANGGIMPGEGVLKLDDPPAPSVAPARTPGQADGALTPQQKTRLEELRALKAKRDAERAGQ